MKESVLLDDCESVALWPGLEVSRELRTQGRASLRWDYTKGADWSIRRRRMPGLIDLTGYNAIEFDMYFDTDVVFGVFILIFDVEVATGDQGTDLLAGASLPAFGGDTEDGRPMALAHQRDHGPCLPAGKASGRSLCLCGGRFGGESAAGLSGERGKSG